MSQKSPSAFDSYLASVVVVFARNIAAAAAAAVVVVASKDCSRLGALEAWVVADRGWIGERSVTALFVRMDWKVVPVEH